jgi:hypothetical protein
MATPTFTSTGQFRFADMNSKPIVTIKSDGTIEIGDGMTIQGAAREAALIFWAEFGQALKELKDA